MRGRPAGTFQGVDSLKGRRVLLVDDDDSQREIVEEILRAEQMIVASAGSADEAVVFLEQDPDVVLLDLHGVRVEPLLDALHRRPRRPALLVVSGDLKLPERASRMGADGHLAKPYELNALLRAVAAVLARTGEGHTDTHR